MTKGQLERELRERLLANEDARMYLPPEPLRRVVASLVPWFMEIIAHERTLERIDAGGLP